MARPQGLLTVDEEDSLRESNTTLLNRNSRMCPVPPQGVLKGLNTSFAAAILRVTPETNQMTTKRKEGGLRREVGSQLFRRMTRARFASLLGTRNPPPLPALPGLVTKLRPSAPTPLQPCIKEESSVPSSSQPHSSASKHESTHHSGRPPKKRALLVGITYHDSTSPIWTPLEGLHVDVMHFQKLLIGAYFIRRSVVLFYGP